MIEENFFISINIIQVFSPDKISVYIYIYIWTAQFIHRPKRPAKRHKANTTQHLTAPQAIQTNKSKTSLKTQQTTTKREPKKQRKQKQSTSVPEGGSVQTPFELVPFLVRAHLRKVICERVGRSWIKIHRIAAHKI